MTAAFETLLEQALQLSEEERGELATRLLSSLEPEDGDEASLQEWEAAPATKLDRRLHEVRDGRAELADGGEVIAELHEVTERA